MGAIAKYTEPDDFEGLVDAVRAFILVDLGLGIESDHRVKEEKVPHHHLSIGGIEVGIDIVDGDGSLVVVTGDEFELMDIVRGTPGRPPLMTADQAVDILRAAAKGVARA